MKESVEATRELVVAVRLLANHCYDTELNFETERSVLNMEEFAEFAKVANVAKEAAVALLPEAKNLDWESTDLQVPNYDD